VRTLGGVGAPEQLAHTPHNNLIYKKTIMIDLSQLTNEELLQHKKDVDSYIRNKKIVEPDFYLHKSIEIENKSYVNSETLIPTLEIKISVNKEDMEHFRILWEQYYKEQKEFYRYHKYLPPECQTTIDIKHQITRKFIDYLDNLFPST
jgi:hypothetical protein